MTANIDFNLVVDHIIDFTKCRKLKEGNMHFISHNTLENEFNIRFKEDDYNDIYNRLFERDEVKNARLTFVGYLLMMQ